MYRFKKTYGFSSSANFNYKFNGSLDTSNEYAEIYLILGECLGNAAEAVREYSVRYPHRHHPDNKVFLRLNQRVRDTGRLVATHKVGRPRTTRTPALEEAVFEVVEDQPHASVRQIARELV
jgi:hypothetical protein